MNTDLKDPIRTLTHSLNHTLSMRNMFSHGSRARARLYFSARSYVAAIRILERAKFEAESEEKE